MVMAFATSLWIGILGAACMLVGWIVLGMPGALWSWKPWGRRSYGTTQIVRLPLSDKHRELLGALLVLVGSWLTGMAIVGVFDPDARARNELMYDTFTRSKDEPISRDR